MAWQWIVPGMLPHIRIYLIEKWLKCLYRIFMQSFFFAPVNLQIVSIKYIQNQQNRKLWGNDISIFQMFHACEDERLIAEVLIGFVLSCGHKKGIGTSADERLSEKK
ncbi:MAG: hypothetical protein ACLRH0_13340 [Blautia wexlerae]